MKIVETTKGRLVLCHRGVVSELAVLLFMALFGGLAWAVFPVDVKLSFALLGCVIIGAVLYLLISVRTTVIFDRVHNMVLIRRQSAFRARDREVPLAEVTEATLLTDGGGRADGAGIVALALRPGSPRKTVPLLTEGLPRREAAETLGTINNWLGMA